jgi:hypothetical protein
MKKALLSLLLLVSTAAVAEAQVKNRWRLTWSSEKPRLYTYRSPNDNYQNFWYVAFAIENNPVVNNNEICPLIFDVLLYTESGKELQHDVRKTDSATIKEEREFPRRSESLKYGRFYANVIDPEVEYKIIEHHARIGNRSDGIIRSSIEDFKKGFPNDPPPDFKGRWQKGDRLYLNPREIRDMRYIQPGQRITGIAIFKNVDPRAQVYELHVSGLWDIVKIVAVNEDEYKMEYEPVTMRVRWFRQGDPFDIERDFVFIQPKAPEYVVKKIGPIGSKDTVDKLVLSLADALKREREWKEQNLEGENLQKARAREGIDPGLDCRVMAMVFRMATQIDFGYDPTKEVLENEKAVWRIHEWWITNRSKLLFNEITNRFEIKDDVPAGTIPEKKPGDPK